MRIVIGGFHHETNTFAPTKADHAAFEHGGGWPGLSEGAAIFAAMGDSNIPAAGFIAAARKDGHEIIPTIWAAASPSAHVTQDAYERIANSIVSGVRQALPVDAVYLDLHGAMVAEHFDDGEGELLRRVRAVVGSAIPIVTSLDLHANVTRQMLQQADMLVAYRTYPHVDMNETGRRAYAGLRQRVARGRRPALASRRIPFLIPICFQSTQLEPAGSLYQQLAKIEFHPGVLGLSFATGFPAADFEECGPRVWGYADTQAQADAAVNAMADLVEQAEAAFQGELLSPGQAISRALELTATPGAPVVIADAQDNPGAGANSDTTGMLRTLIAMQVPQAAIGLIVDPSVAAIACQAGEGASIHVRLGGHSNIPADAPLEADFVVEKISDGRFQATGPYFGGFNMNLGPSACLRIGDVRVVVSTHKAQMADQAMFRFIGIEPTQQRILVVKSTVHFRADFRPIAREILTAIAPGPMSMLPTDWTWRHLPGWMHMYPGGPRFDASPDR